MTENVKLMASNQADEPDGNYLAVLRNGRARLVFKCAAAHARNMHYVLKIKY